MGMPPSGNEFAIGGLTLLRIAEGKIAEHWVGGDFLGLMQQVGALPAPGEPM
jgi:predicted ester cyclase